ncbi:MAG: hypothetical protein U0903_16825 [Planctomycetales bacterium]
MSQFIPQLLITLCALTMATDPRCAKAEESPVKVECHGQLRTGIVAIGGETTGTTITFDRITWELKLPDEDSRMLAMEHNKKPVTVTGKLRRVKGQAISVRWILDVEKLSVRDASLLKEGANLTVAGTLKAAGDSAGFEIAAGNMVWPLDLSADSDIKDRAESLAGKSVVLRGRLERDPKAEISAKRTILHVKKLESADDVQK